MANRTNFASGSPPFLAHGTGQPPPAQPIPRPPGVLGMNTGAALAAAPGAARRALEDLARPREDSPGLSVARLSEGASPIGDQVRTAVGQFDDRYPAVRNPLRAIGDHSRAWLEEATRPREDSPGLSVARLSEGASPIGDQVRTAVGQAGDRGRAWVEELANDPDADEETREMRRQLLGMPALPSRDR